MEYSRIDEDSERVADDAMRYHHRPVNTMIKLLTMMMMMMLLAMVGLAKRTQNREWLHFIHTIHDDFRQIPTSRTKNGQLRRAWSCM